MNTNTTKIPVRFALMLAAFSTLWPLSFDMYLPAFPEMMRFFHTDASTIQASLTSCLIGLALGQIVMGSLSDVYGRRRPLMIAMTLYILASIGCAFAPNMLIFIAFRFIQGFAVAAGTVSNAIVRDSFSGVELTKFYSLLAMIGNVAPLLAPIAGSVVISFAPWKGLFLLLALQGIFLFIVAKWGLKETLPAERRVSGNFMVILRNFKALLQDRMFMGYALTQGFLFTGIFAYISGTSFIYQNIYGVSPGVFSLLFAMNGIALFLGAQLVKRLAGRVAGRRIHQIGLTSAFITSTAVLIVVLSHGSLLALVIPLLLFISSFGVSGAAAFPLAMESQGHIAGSAAALLGVIPFIFGAVTSPLVGIAGEHSAVPFGIILFTASLLAIISYIGLTKPAKRTDFL
ncbi:multidrug effflux MFS transporter [Paenibacillus chartarius]|uniref:Bcr/CflA family efflux transporter n=1 Tax=Paenibacillus chartarius TaxID=747481 RepID=A0ABV6DHX5_9BACL